jgi:hypothetical protein
MLLTQSHREKRRTQRRKTISLSSISSLCSLFLSVSQVPKIIALARMSCSKCRGLPRQRQPPRSANRGVNVVASLPASPFRLRRTSRSAAHGTRLLITDYRLLITLAAANGRSVSLCRTSAVWLQPTAALRTPKAHAEPTGRAAPGTTGRKGPQPVGPGTFGSRGPYDSAARRLARRDFFRDAAFL